METKEYLKCVFHMMARVGGLNFGTFRSRFNRSEIRLIEELVLARERGERLIATEISRILGITRAAVSQIIDNLERFDVVKRCSDEINRRIAYIELTEEAEEVYSKERKAYIETISRAVETMGEEKFKELLELSEEFCAKVEENTDSLRNSRYLG